MLTLRPQRRHRVLLRRLTEHPAAILRHLMRCCCILLLLLMIQYHANVVRANVTPLRELGLAVVGHGTGGVLVRVRRLHFDNVVLLLARDQLPVLFYTLRLGLPVLAVQIVCVIVVLQLPLPILLFTRFVAQGPENFALAKARARRRRF